MSPKLRAVEYVLTCANCHRRFVLKVIPFQDKWRENCVCPYCLVAITVTSDLEQKPDYDGST